MERETIQAIPKAQVATRFGQRWNGVELQNYFQVSDLWSVPLSHNSPLRFRFVAFSTPINLASNCNN
jgi:hypothetical protein